MVHAAIRGLVVFITLTLHSVLVFAQETPSMEFMISLKTALQEKVDGQSLPVRCRFYEIAEGGQVLWEAEHEAENRSGSYHFAMDPDFVAFIAAEADRLAPVWFWLEIAIDGDVLHPRQLFNKLPALFQGYGYKYEAEIAIAQHAALREGGAPTLVLGDTIETGTNLNMDVNSITLGGVTRSTWPDGPDNLGNHTATGNIKLNGNWLSGDGGGEGLFITNNGDIGVGTNAPSQKLHVAGSLRLTGPLYDYNNTSGSTGQMLQTTGGGVQWVSQTGTNDMDWTIGTTYLYSNKSKVGIGTVSPLTVLDLSGPPVAGRGQLNITDPSGDDPFVSFYAGGTWKSHFGYSDGRAVWGTNDGSNLYIHGGDVSIGTTDVNGKLTVKTASGNALVAANNGSGNYVELGRASDALHAVSFNSDIVAVYAQSTNGISIKGVSTNRDGIWGETLANSKSGVVGNSVHSGGFGVWGVNSSRGNHGYLGGVYGVYGYSAVGYAAAFKGNVAVISPTTNELLVEIGEGLDYAEGFDVTDKSGIKPGAVLVIDPDNPGRLKLSSVPYDTKVAGIVAGGNSLGSGVRLGAGQFDHNVALAGRVYCNVETSGAAVEPGDLLTTSPIPGHAMKSLDYSRAQGAVLGKAMQPLAKGEKKQILVLVTLQ